MNYAKLLEISSFFILHIFLEVGKTQDILSKIWQTLGDALVYRLGHTPIFLERLKCQHLQEFAIFYLAYLVFCQLLKKYVK